MFAMNNFKNIGIGFMPVHRSRMAKRMFMKFGVGEFTKICRHIEL
jgi:hypothetical protein